MKNLILVLIVVIGFNAHAGSEGGGGGVGVDQGDNPMMLLDLYAYGPSTLAKDEKAEDKVEVDRVVKTLGYRPVNVKELDAFLDFQDRAAIWRPHFPEVFHFIDMAAKNMTWRFTDYEMPLVTSRLGVSEKVIGPIRSTLIPVVYYDRGNHAIANIAAWNQLGSLSRAALILHEAFRHIQMTYRLFDSDEKLNQITAVIMTLEPGEVDLLDYTSDHIRESVLFKRELITRLKVATQPLCDQSDIIETDLKDQINRSESTGYPHRASKLQKDLDEFRELVLGTCKDPTQWALSNEVKPEMHINRVMYIRQEFSQLETGYRLRGHKENSEIILAFRQSFKAYGRVIESMLGRAMQTWGYGSIDILRALSPYQILGNIGEDILVRYAAGEERLRGKSKRTAKKVIREINKNLSELKAKYSD